MDSLTDGFQAPQSWVQLIRRSTSGILLLLIGICVTFLCAWPTLAAVELATFTVSTSEDVILLQWQTVEEQQLAGFDVFCKNENEPESAYHLIGNVAAEGSAEQGFDYEFVIDRGLVPGESYCFRIQENTTDGSAPEKLDRCGYGLNITPTPPGSSTHDAVVSSETLTLTPTTIAIDPGTVTPGPTDGPTATPTATLTATVTLTTSATLTTTAVATTSQEVGTPTATITVSISTPTPTPVTPTPVPPETATPTVTPIGESPIDPPSPTPTPAPVGGESPLDTPANETNAASIDGAEGATTLEQEEPTATPTETPTESPTPIPLDDELAANDVGPEIVADGESNLSNVENDAATGGNGVEETEQLAGQEENASAAYVIITATPTPEMEARLISPTFTPFPTAMPAPAFNVSNVMVPSTQNLMVLFLCLIFFSASGLGILGLVTSVFYMRSSRSKRR